MFWSFACLFVCLFECLFVYSVPFVHVTGVTGVVLLLYFSFRGPNTIHFLLLFYPLIFSPSATTLQKKPKLPRDLSWHSGKLKRHCINIG